MLKAEIIKLIDTDKMLFSILMGTLGYKESKSLRTKLNENHPNLTRDDVLKAIQKHTGLSREEILEN